MSTMSTISTRSARAKWGVVVIILLLFLLLTPVLFRLRALPFDSDEAVHAVEGLRLAIDLKMGHLDQALRDTYFRRWYPPGLSLYLAPFFVVFGPEHWAARYPLLLLFLLGIALLYRAGRELWDNECAAVGAAVLGATSSVLWMEAAHCMEESLALIGVLVTLIAYARAVKWGRGWLGVGIATAATFLFRTSSGVFLLGAIFLVLVIHRREWKERRVFLKALGPGVLTIVLWWGHPYKVGGARDYFVASVPGFSSFTPSTLLHYWGQMLRAYTVGWGIGLLVVLGIVLSVFRWFRCREPRVELLLLLVLGTWGSLVLKRQMATRLFYIALPPAFLLASHEIVTVWRAILARIPRHAVRVKIAVAGILGSYFLAAVVMRALTFPLLMEVSYETGPGFVEAADWITAQVAPDEERVFLVNGWDQFSAPALEWALWRSRWKATGEALQVVAVELQDPEKCPTCVETFGRGVLEGPEARIVHLENTPVLAAGAWWAYRAVLVPCWDGEWEATAQFWVSLWDGLLTDEILAHPARFLGRAGQETVQQFHYSLLMEVHTVAWEECRVQQ